MLNVVFWLSGICLCQALSDYRPRNTNWRRESLEPWQQFCKSHFNSSKSLKYYPRFCPRSRTWPPNSFRRYPRPPFQFNPYFPEIHPKHCFPFINSIPVNHRLSPLETAGIQKYRRMRPSSNQIFLNEKNKNEIKDNMKCEESSKGYDCANVIFNDTCLQLPQNETMIISPSILIGQKNNSLQNDEWILSNKPIGVYLKKITENKNMFKVLKSTDTDKDKYKRNWLKYIDKKQDITKAYEDNVDSTTCSCPNKFNQSLNFEKAPSFISDEEENCSPIYTTSTDKIVSTSHPIKKKVYKLSNVEYIKLIPNDRKYKNINFTTELISKNVASMKHRWDVKNHKKNRRFRRFYSFPNMRHNLKRSCKDHRQFKRMTLTTNPNELDDYLDEPVYFDDYGYESDDDSYPQENNYRENIFLNDYSYYSDSDPLCFENRSDVCFQSNTSELPSQENTDEHDLISNISDLEKELSNSSLFVSFNKNKKDNLKDSDIKQALDESFDLPLNKEEDEFDLNQFKQSCIIKNLTDELEEKMDLLNNLTKENLLSVRKKLSFDRATYVSKTNEDLKTVSTPMLETALKKVDEGLDDKDELPLLNMFVSPNKAMCERSNSQRCVCSPSGMINFFSKELQKGSDTKIILKKLITYSCEVYTPIALEYQIAADMKPRLISKKKRELVESEFGPREISPFAFDELMMRGIPKEGVDFFVFPSTTVEIPCFTSDEMKLSPNIADSALYRWSHSNFKAITEGRILEDSNHKGSLIIQDVTLADTDNYTCKVKYIDPDSQITVKRTFIHAVKVVMLPRLALHTNLHYSASSLCDQELLEMFELYLPQQIESSICSLGKTVAESLCTIEIHNPVCYTKNKQDSEKRSIDPRLLWRTDFQKSRWIREILHEDIPEMEISLNYELDLARIPRYVPDAMNWSICSPHCQQKLSLKTIEILRDSFLDALLVPVKTKSVQFQPSLDSINMKMLTACDGGLELTDGFCVPCQKHHYSEQGKTVCLACPAGTFQDNIGAKSCIPCPHPFRPNCFHLSDKKNFTMITFAIIIGWALLGACYLIGSKLSIKALAKKKVKRKKPEPLPPDFE